MILLKKLIFVPIFLIVFGLLIYFFVPFLKSYDFIFSLSINTFIDLLVLSALISLSSFLFVLLGTLALDWKIVLAAGTASSAISMIFIDPALGLILTVATFVSLLLTYVSLDNSLKSYLTFKPETLLGPSVRHLSGLLILSFCLIYFLSSNKLIAENGFSIPDSLIDTALKMTPLPTEQVQMSVINTDLIRDTIKQTAKDQIQGFIKPYQSFIPAVLAVLLFLTLQSLTSILNLFIYPLLWLIFFILEKTGFVKFEIEQREVKKLVIS